MEMEDYWNLGRFKLTLSIIILFFSNTLFTVFLHLTLGCDLDITIQINDNIFWV